MRTLEVICAPLLRLLLASGLDYTQLAAALKPWFIDQAQQVLLSNAQKDTDSAISLLSGVHRKDVREWRHGRLGINRSQELSVPSQVFTRWMQDPLYVDQHHRLRPLVRIGPAPSFEALARGVTQDIHPFTVLAELLRLGLASVEVVNDVEMVIPKQDGFVPPPGSLEQLQLMQANLADHISAATLNLMGDAPRLEQSVFAEGITSESVEILAQLARQLWARARTEMIAEARRLYANDQGRADAKYRMRFGTYYWNETLPESNDTGDSAPGDPLESK